MGRTSLGISSRRATSPASVLVIVISGIALAVITELGQATEVGGRDADIWDGMADSAGVVLGLVVAAWLARSKAPEPAPSP